MYFHAGYDQKKQRDQKLWYFCIIIVVTNWLFWFVGKYNRWNLWWSHFPFFISNLSLFNKADYLVDINNCTVYTVQFPYIGGGEYGRILLQTYIYFSNLFSPLLILLRTSRFIHFSMPKGSILVCYWVR